MGAIVTAILSFIGGPVINAGIQAYRDRLKSIDQKDEHALELARADMMAQIEARKQLVTALKYPLVQLMQFLMAFPFAVYIAKVVLWDKVLKWGITDPITGAVGVWGAMIVGFYFGSPLVSPLIDTVVKRFQK
jgi:uncharacterized membrane protein (UPF0182 family)